GVEPAHAGDDRREGRGRGQADRGVGDPGGGGVAMFSLDRWMEVLDTIRRNKLRTALTAISVAWGIFVLVFLLGLGNGLNNGLHASFARDAMNGVWIMANK